MNITPDSFYGGSRLTNVDNALKQAEKMLKEGATILDIGGQSTRPKSVTISADEENERVVPVIEKIRKEFPHCFISIDTFYSETALQAVNAGADMVNDISSGTIDSNMISMVAQLNVPYIAMHMRGTPATMQNFTNYSNVTEEVLSFFVKKIEECKKAGIKDIIIDPGFGFAKTIEQNFKLLRKMSALKILQLPVLAGLSRKSMIYKTLGTTAEEALNGTTVLHSIAILNGANILRVHDVKEAKETVNLLQLIVDN